MRVADGKARPDSPLRFGGMNRAGSIGRATAMRRSARARRDRPGRSLGGHRQFVGMGRNHRAQHLPAHVPAGVAGLSPTSAGLSLMMLMVSHNIASALAGPIVGRVKRYKLLPLCLLVVGTAAATTLAWQTDHMTPLACQITLLLIGAGFGPVTPLTLVALQNAVERHQLGIAISTMNFMRNLFSTVVVALLGVIALAAASSVESTGAGQLGDKLSPDALNAAEAFGRVFYAIAACLGMTFVALFLIEERPLRSGARSA